jgi:hypothetical protein
MSKCVCCKENRRPVWSEKFSASTLDGTTIDKIFFVSLYVCHKHPCEIASHCIKQYVLYSCLKQKCCLYPLKRIKLGIVRSQISL